MGWSIRNCSRRSSYSFASSSWGRRADAEACGPPYGREVTRFHIQLMMDVFVNPKASAKENAMAKLDYKELNAVQQYSQHAVFKVIPNALGTERAEIIAQAQEFFAGVERPGR